MPGLGPDTRQSNLTCFTHKLHWRIKKLVGLSGEVMDCDTVKSPRPFFYSGAEGPTGKHRSRAIVLSSFCSNLQNSSLAVNYFAPAFAILHDRKFTNLGTTPEVYANSTRAPAFHRNAHLIQVRNYVLFREVTVANLAERL